MLNTFYKGFKNIHDCKHMTMLLLIYTTWTSQSIVTGSLPLTCDCHHSKHVSVARLPGQWPLIMSYTQSCQLTIFTTLLTWIYCLILQNTNYLCRTACIILYNSYKAEIENLADS